MLFTFMVEVFVPSVIERHRETLGMESRVWVIVRLLQRTGDRMTRGPRDHCGARRGSC